jgi:hypothetical protein
VIEIGRRRTECLLTTLARILFRIAGNPILAMAPCEMDERIGLGFRRGLTPRMTARIGYTCIRIVLFCIRMSLSHMLEIGGLLDKLLLRTMCTDKFEILYVLGLNVIIHRILLRTTLITMLALELTGF